MLCYLFSGIDKKNGFNLKQSEYLRRDIKSNLNIVFISSIFNDYKRNDEQLSVYLKLFEDIHIKFNKYSIIDNRINKEKAQKLIENTDIVFLLGGSPELQMKSINEYDLASSIKKVDIALGVSAGSMNQSKRVMYKDDFDNFVMKDYEGLSLVDIHIFPHYDENNKSFVEEVNEINHFIPLVLLPNESFVRVKNNYVEYVGKYMILEKNQ